MVLLKGAVSWESIARARLKEPNASLRDCIEEPVEVKVETPLLEAVQLIAESEFLFVRARDKTVCGIVTTMDLSDQFASLAGPFLILSEIEQLLRVALDRVFSADEMFEAVSPMDDRVFEGSHSLTLGEVQRLVENPARWDRIGWPPDRRIFVNALDEIREIRNEIMHFSPDPLEEERLYKLKAFLGMMRDLVAT